ncbi:hypothetical protein DL98DRAFT_273150 [Cadophora sp. DSE1049]|nr:hypothetical protein DL98DRAFT_273150 [Cadophora sp. DSE1049]
MHSVRTILNLNTHRELFIGCNWTPTSSHQPYQPTSTSTSTPAGHQRLHPRAGKSNYIHSNPTIYRSLQTNPISPSSLVPSHHLISHAFPRTYICFFLSPPPQPHLASPGYNKYPHRKR